MRAKTILLALIVVATLWGADTKINIAVLPLKVSGGISEDEGTILTKKLTSELVKSGKYVVLDRSEMESILKEQGFQQAGCTTDACAIEVGQLLGVRKIILCSLGKLENIYSISIKIVDVESGEIIRTVSTETKDNMKSVIKDGISKVTEKICWSPMSAEDIEKNYQKRNKTRKILAFTTGGVGVVTGGLATYFWIDRKNQHDSYMASKNNNDINKYKSAKNDAETKAIVFTAISGTLISTSTILFIIKPKKEEIPKISLGGFFTPERSSFQVSYRF